MSTPLYRKADRVSRQSDRDVSEHARLVAEVLFSTGSRLGGLVFSPAARGDEASRGGEHVRRPSPVAEAVWWIASRRPPLPLAGVAETPALRGRADGRSGQVASGGCVTRRERISDIWETISERVSSSLVSEFRWRTSPRRSGDRSLCTRQAPRRRWSPVGQSRGLIRPAEEAVRDETEAPVSGGLLKGRAARGRLRLSGVVPKYLRRSAGCSRSSAVG